MSVVLCSLIKGQCSIYSCRTVSRNSGEDLANEFDCHFHETSAAEDFCSVEEVFHEIIKDIARLNDLNITLQPLFISEPDKACSSHNSMNSSNGSHNSHSQVRRPKPPKTTDSFKLKVKEKEDPKVIPRKNNPAFKFFFNFKPKV